MTIHRSPFPDVEIPDITITELVLSGLAARGHAPAIIDGTDGRVMTAAALADGIRRFAGGLAARGIGPGDVVAILAPNLPEYALVFHGAAYAGATVTTLNPTYTEEEVARQLRDASARLLVTVAPLLATAQAASAEAGFAEVAVIGAADGATPLAALMGDPLAAQVPVDPATHLAVLPYSSGTTGLPKGVMLTHRNLVANVVQVRAVIDIPAGLSTLAFLPYFHIYGMTVLLNGYLAAGAVQVTLPRFDFEAMLRLIAEHRMRHLYVAPPVALALAKHPLVDVADLSSLDFVLSGAAPLGAELSLAAERRLGCAMIQGYGMTEMSPVSHFTPPGRNRHGAAGLTAPNTECRVVDAETLQDVAAGSEGELWVRGPQVMAGYLGRPDATAETLTADGWLRTGDLVHIDADGYLFVVDRVKELIKVKGFQVAPAELEALLITHPDVADVAVVGLPDPEAGEVPAAYIVASPGTDPDLPTLQAHLDGHVAHFKQIRVLHRVEAIPKSPSGKILRRMLRGLA
jgi:acyl-CoA synthetase (AMP-forming)/AMP-acid ligase II